MNSIEELRRTLEQHADGLHDTERVERPAAVRSRIRTARRRRAGSVVVAAAVALAVATGTAGLLRGSETPEPAGPVVVPERVVVSQFPYRLVDTVTVGEDGTVDLGATGLRVVVLAASGLGDGAATLWVGDVLAVARVAGDEQASSPTMVSGQDLSVALDDVPEGARAELGVYEPTGELPPGIASDGVVFRQRIGDLELVTAAYGDASTPARIEVPDAGDDIEVFGWCRTRTDHSLHTEPSSNALTCAPWAYENADAAAGDTGDFRFAPGEESLTTYVTEGDNGPRTTDGEVELGIAAYRLAVRKTEVLGFAAPTVIENDGRSWRLDEVVEPEDGRYEVDTSSGDVLFGVVTVGDEQNDLTWRGAYDRSSGGWGGSTPGDPTWGLGGVLWHGDRYVIELAQTGPAPDSRLVLYRPE